MKDTKMKHKITGLWYTAPSECVCKGILNLDIDGVHYTFDKPFWESGGSVIWNDGEGTVTHGDWILNEAYIPKNITKELAEEIIEAMNLYAEIRGCCGSCI